MSREFIMDREEDRRTLYSVIKINPDIELEVKYHSRGYWENWGLTKYTENGESKFYVLPYGAKMRVKEDQS